MIAVVPRSKLDSPCAIRAPGHPKAADIAGAVFLGARSRRAIAPQPVIHPTRTVSVLSLSAFVVKDTLLVDTAVSVSL
jgi:hypothetical protein